MSAIAAHITSLTIGYSTVYPGADQSKHQSSASLAFVCGIHRGPVNSPHKWPVTRKMFPFDDVIMITEIFYSQSLLILIIQVLVPSIYGTRFGLQMPSPPQVPSSVDFDIQQNLSILQVLTHLPLVPHICVSESGQHWFIKWWVGAFTWVKVIVFFIYFYLFFLAQIQQKRPLSC